MAGGIVDQVEPPDSSAIFGPVENRERTAAARGRCGGRKRIASAVVERLVGGAVDQLGFVR
jgi:hypothetical protein